jgi:hypothetical protein
MRRRRWTWPTVGYANKEEEEPREKTRSEDREQRPETEKAEVATFGQFLNTGIQ